MSASDGLSSDGTQGHMRQTLPNTKISNHSCTAGQFTVLLRPEAAGRFMQSLRILYTNEVRFMPSRSAAPFGPPITQLLASSMRRI